MDIPEKDWKLYRKHFDDLMNRQCEKIFTKLEALMEVESLSPHEKYLELWRLMKREDEIIEAMFDNPKRSTAYHKLAVLRAHGLLTDELFSLLTNESQERINRILE